MNPTEIPGVYAVSVQKNGKHIGPDKMGRLEEVLSPGDQVELKVVVEIGYGLNKIVRLKDGELVAVDGQSFSNGMAAFWKICKVAPGRSGLGHVQASDATIRLVRADEKNGMFYVYEISLATVHGGNMVSGHRVQSWQFYRGHANQLMCVDLKTNNLPMYELACKFFKNTSHLPHISKWVRTEEEAGSGLHALLT